MRAKAFIIGMSLLTVATQVSAAPTNFTKTIQAIVANPNSKAKQESGGIKGDILNPTAAITFHKAVATRSDYVKQTTERIETLATELGARLNRAALKSSIEGDSQGARFLAEALKISGDAVVATGRAGDRATREDVAQSNTAKELQTEAIELLSNSEKIAVKGTEGDKIVQAHMRGLAEALLGNVNARGELELWAGNDIKSWITATKAMNQKLNEANPEQGVKDLLGEKAKDLINCSRG